MPLTLTIENMSSLPDGGPLSITVSEKRGIDIGRNAFLDWTLPDPSRFISGKHCEVRFQDGDFLLYDVSTNGTFLNGAQRRMQSPHRLRGGDRLLIGDYVVAVSLDRASTKEEGSGAPAAIAEYWAPEGEAAPPIDPRQLRPSPDRRAIHADFLEQSMGNPDLYDLRGKPPAEASMPPDAAPEPDDALDWAPLAPRPKAEPEPPRPAPSPRRAAGSLPSPALWGDPPGGDESRADAASRPPAVSARAEEPMQPPSDADMPRLPVASPFMELAPADSAAPPQQGAFAAPAAQPLDFLRMFAEAAGFPDGLLEGADPARLAQLAGDIVRSTIVEMMQLLRARNEARRLARNPNQTVVGASDNNPLKFAPTPEDAMRILFGPPTRSYLDARRAIAEGFADIKSHHVLTYSAMQAAVRRLAEELDPAEIEKALPPAAGIGERLGSNKARLWDSYTTRWEAKTEHHDDGLVDVFMLYFGDCYAKATRGGS